MWPCRPTLTPHIRPCAHRLRAICSPPDRRYLPSLRSPDFRSVFLRGLDSSYRVITRSLAISACWWRWPGERARRCGCGNGTRDTFLDARAPRTLARCATMRLRGLRSSCSGSRLFFHRHSRTAKRASLLRVPPFSASAKCSSRRASIRPCARCCSTSSPREPPSSSSPNWPPSSSANVPARTCKSPRISCSTCGAAGMRYTT